jgi:tRNA/rRNA methyltransferase
MASADPIRETARGGPAIILVKPQLGENIGTAARAMHNFGLGDLRLVQPRDGWPNVKAVSAAAGASAVLDTATVFDTAAEAVADLHHVFATTARPRDMIKPVVTPRRAAADMRRWRAAGESSGVVFGRERTGLDNDDVALADAVVAVPINPDYASLNLAQAVLLVGYEWLNAGTDAPEERLPEGQSRPATHGEIENFFGHLERELDACGFLRNKEKRPTMVRNIRNLFLRAGLMEQEVRTLHGVVAELSRDRGAGDEE